MSNSLNIKEEPSKSEFPIVGIGASAGGLDAFKQLVKFIPEHSGMAYILVQHLEPSHESMLTDLLQKVTVVPVLEITNNIKIEVDHIYIIPSNALLTVNDGLLQLSARLPATEKNMPIDVFFTSLAELHEEHAIGIILSGTATDGTAGLKAIKGHGGITFAQEPASAAFPGMPQNAIDADVVDFIVVPKEMPKRLMELNKALKTDITEQDTDAQPAIEDIFRKILSVLRLRKGVDFTFYKQTTIRRRILRRMGLNKMQDVSAYLSFFKESIVEQDTLYQDILIPVTEFFRDPKTYKALCETIFPALVKNREGNNPVRLWIAGCSTGEEPYSMAICLHEHLGNKAADIKIQIFATDISEKSIAKARSGIYTPKEAANLSSEQLNRYFTKVNGSFQVNREVREMCVFAIHNFLDDPPFARMDLISCRNVLIYMVPFLQKKALTTFHYALKENGYLLLGKSETTAPAPDLFTAASKTAKLYVRKALPGRFSQMIGDRGEGMGRGRVYSMERKADRDDFQKSADNVLLAKYAPAGVVVNSQMDIVQFRGATGTWLESSPGKPSLNVLKMAREGLSFELRNALHKAKECNQAQVKENIPMLYNGSNQLVNIEVIPLLNTMEPFYLVLFTTLQRERSDQVETQALSLQHEQENTRGHLLEKELAQAREDMRSIIEVQETANEKLQNANEELLSGTEELQSLNEELETSKEEIQSTNEELTTLNQELFDRNDQLNTSRIYAESIIATIREPLIILDKYMRVKTANRAYYNVFKTTEDQTEGKKFLELDGGYWNIPDLCSLLEDIMNVGKAITGFEIRRSNSHIETQVMLVNANRIFTHDKNAPLILLAIEDVTDKHKMASELERFTRELEELVDARTLELRNTNLSLQYSNENLEQFAYVTSHDLQEPLRKIRTFASILKTRYSDETSAIVKENIDKIDKAATRMSQLISDLLNFARSQNPQSDFGTTDLNEIIQQVIDDFDLLIAQKKAVISYDQLPVIEGIPLQINQLFHNLLSNALKFSSTDKPLQVDITVKIFSPGELKKQPALNEHSSHCEIIFNDNGIGFEPQFSGKIFMIFQQLNSRSDFEGTGIGLALCKKIVINHHGDIYAESVKGKGTQIHIILPLKQ